MSSVHKKPIKVANSQGIDDAISIGIQGTQSECHRCLAEDSRF